MEKYKSSVVIFEEQAIAVGTPVYHIVNTRIDNYEGYGSLQLVDQVSVATTGVLKVEVETSNDGVNWSIPMDNTGTALDNVVVTAHADGTALYEFPPVPIANFYRYKFTASTNNITSVKAYQSLK